VWEWGGGGGGSSEETIFAIAIEGEPAIDGLCPLSPGGKDTCKPKWLKRRMRKKKAKETM
jgi:hypothetical protein